MKNFVKVMIEEHAHVEKKINKYINFYNNAVNSPKVDKTTCANVALLIRDYKNTARTLQTCLENEGIIFTPDGEYYEKVGEINAESNE